MGSPFQKLAYFCVDLLHKPFTLFVICSVLVLGNLLLDGSLIQLWSLHRDFDVIGDRITEMKGTAEKLSMKIKQTSDPSFIEVEAQNRFDLVNEDDLVFIFSEDPPNDN